MNAKPAIKFFLRLLPRHPSKGTSTIPIIGNTTSAANADCGLSPGNPWETARAVVTILTVIAMGVVPVGIAELGEILQVEACGTPKQLNCTAPENPPLAARLKSKFAVPPAATVAVAGSSPMR